MPWKKDKLSLKTNKSLEKPLKMWESKTRFSDMEEAVRRPDAHLIRIQKKREDRTEKVQCSKRELPRNFYRVTERCDFALRMKKIPRIQSRRERGKKINQSGLMIVTLQETESYEKEGSGSRQKDKQPTRQGH